MLAIITDTMPSFKVTITNYHKPSDLEQHQFMIS